MTPLMTAPTRFRPIRELLFPGIEIPLQPRAVLTERRRERRFARQLAGVLIDGEAYHSVWCVDISYAGVKVVAPTVLSFVKGQRVVVKIKQSTRSFQDEFTVVDAEATPKGTVLHLAL
ncbi:MAG TPA: PilZ domain-containing protein [Phycisphaerae bacterium]|nr:PilZ domain-containing protein [Phycisphaerae bacterium]